MLDFESAKRVARERWLCAFDGEPGGPQIFHDDECVEYEWGWLIAWGPSEPEKVPVEERRWRPLPVLVDRVTGNLQTVGTAGPRIAILKLLESRPAECQSPDISSEEVSGLTRVKVSMRAFTPLRDLQGKSSDAAKSVEVFHRA